MTMEAGDSRSVDELSAAYAAWRSSLLGQITDSVESKLLQDALGPLAGLRILDVGCGDGTFSTVLARAGADVTAVDRCWQMIDFARSRAAGDDTTIRFQAAEAKALPFPSNTFDVVTTIATLCFIHNVEAAVLEMGRVLNPGGRLIVGELGRFSSWAALRRIKGWCGSPIWRNARFQTPSGLRTLAHDAGLVNVSVKAGVFYPPITAVARLLGPFDRRIGAFTKLGAAFLVLVATKPERFWTRL